MSDPLTHPYSFGLPEGRRLDVEGEDRLAEGVVFNISMFPRATPKRIEAARKYIREIPDERQTPPSIPGATRRDGRGVRVGDARTSTSSIPRPAVQSRSRSQTGTSRPAPSGGTRTRSRQSSSATWVEAEHHEAGRRVQAQAGRHRLSAGSFPRPA